MWMKVATTSEIELRSPLTNKHMNNWELVIWLQHNKAQQNYVKISWAPFYLHGLTLIPAWISNYIHYKVWDEITYPFLNFNGATVEV